MKPLVRMSMFVLLFVVGLTSVGIGQQGATKPEPANKPESQSRDTDARNTLQDLKKAQQEEAAAIQARYKLIPLSVQIVVSRYQGDKKVSSLPYTMAINANGLHPVNGGGKPAQLRMLAQIPVPITAPLEVDGKPLTGLPSGGGPVQYKDIGTNIDGSASSMDDGRFRVNISIEETSVYSDEQAATTPKRTGLPVFRSFRSQNELVLKDGQTGQFTAATDRVSGEVVRVDVTLSVVK